MGRRGCRVNATAFVIREVHVAGHGADLVAGAGSEMVAVGRLTGQ